MRNIAGSVWLPCEAGARRAAATSAGIVTRASHAKLEGIVEEQREGRGQGEVEPDDRVGFPTEFAPASRLPSGRNAGALTSAASLSRSRALLSACRHR